LSLLHFHVVENDVGYLPESDPGVHPAVDDAIRDALDAAERHMEALSQRDEVDIIRGQVTAAEPVTVRQEIDNVQEQVDEIKEWLETDPEFTTRVAKGGLMIVLDDGWRVIEISPCADLDCEIGDSDWI
jgi:hypothetical protein